MSDQIIQIPVAAPSFPLVLADAAFLSTLATVESQASSLTVTDVQSAQQAADLQARLTKAGAALDKARLNLKRLFIDINAQIDATAKEPLARIERAKDAIKTKLTRYDAEQQRIAREAEQKRLAELAALEKKRREEEAELKRKADELAAQAAAKAKAEADAAAKSGTEVIDVSFDDDEAPASPPPKTETELAIERVRFAAPVVAAKPTGVTFRTRLIHRVVDIKLLPESFVIRTEDTKAIRAVFCDGYKEGDALPVCAGIEFTVDRTPVSTGRNVF